MMVMVLGIVVKPLCFFLSQISSLSSDGQYSSLILRDFILRLRFFNCNLFNIHKYPFNGLLVKVLEALTSAKHAFFALELMKDNALKIYINQRVIHIILIKSYSCQDEFSVSE